MTSLDALLELLERVGNGRSGAALVCEEELHIWPLVAVTALKSQRLLVRARPSASAVCPGCQRECVMPVNTLSGPSDVPKSFIVCDKRSDINRVEIAPERLLQWRCSTEAICGFIVENLGLRRSLNKAPSADAWELGIAKGKKRDRMLYLRADSGLSLVAGNAVLPLAEFVMFQKDIYALDAERVSRLVDSSTTADSRYTPSTSKREQGKEKTQAMYESWQAEYRRLKSLNPEKSDKWISLKIANSEVAKGKDSETIRKQMKG